MFERPTHPDFELLSEVIRGLDSEVENGGSVEDVYAATADPDTLRYIGIEMGKRSAFSDEPALALLWAMKHPVALDDVARKASIWLTGFTAGNRFRTAIHKSEVDKRIEEALTMIGDALHTDGAHHLQWYLDQIAKILTGPQYEVWRDGLADRSGYDYEDGTAP